MSRETGGGSPELLPHPVTGGLFASPVVAGSGWPGDPAGPGPAVVTTDDDLRRTAAGSGLEDLSAAVSVCRVCPRLVGWREEVAETKRASYAHEPYWGRPIAGWGSATPRVLVVGLAPAAQGGNRTGRIFTGDRSGDWLFAGLHRVGLAVQPASQHAGDGQRLVDTRMVAAVRCAPPDNKPTTGERDSCAPWLERELELVADHVEAIVCLGGFGWDAALRALRAVGYEVPRPRPRFGHANEFSALGPDGRPVRVLGCYHPSQQNTFTGRLTEAMLDHVLAEAASSGCPARDDAPGDLS